MDADNLGGFKNGRLGAVVLSLGYPANLTQALAKPTVVSRASRFLMEWEIVLTGSSITDNFTSGSFIL